MTRASIPLTGGLTAPPCGQRLDLQPGEEGAGVVQRLAREPDRHRRHLLTLRHRLHDAALMAADTRPLDDQAVEADEICRNAGKSEGCRTRRRSWRCLAAD
jgi:hypothetical protein